MKNEFNEAFDSLFCNSQLKLKNLLNLKIKSSSMNQQLLIMDDENNLIKKLDK